MEAFPLITDLTSVRNDDSAALPHPPPSMTINDAKVHLNRLIAQIRANEQSGVAITSRGGKPQAVIIPRSRYRRYVAAGWRPCADETPPEAYPALIEALIE